MPGLTLADFDYPLPDELIAQSPANPRDSCRLLILRRKTGDMEHTTFDRLGSYLTADDLLVFNNTRVMPARLVGRKESGGKVELLLLQEENENLWQCLVKPGKRLSTGSILSFEQNGISVQAEVISRDSNGPSVVKFAGEQNIRNCLPRIGQIPFPPYVKHPCCAPEEYQTIYSREEGAVAAPTAGLHFTESLLEKLKAKAVATAEITLHVGWGTFRPVRSEVIAEHRPEAEQYAVTQTAAAILQDAENSEKRIIAVGTTTCRVLENFPPGKIHPSSGWTRLFISPGFSFQRTQGLITNFHLPQSTLLLLVSAFAGVENIRKAYREAIAQAYRFYSFGDAMLIVD